MFLRRYSLAAAFSSVRILYVSANFLFSQPLYEV
jgi:hypothetical protein